MQVTYTSRNAEISEQEKRKVQRKFEKIHKILNPNRDLEAHVILSRQRHLCEAEVTLQALHHTLVVTASSAEPLAAVLGAVDKLEKQAVKNKHKLIDGRRAERNRRVPASSPEPTAAAPRADEERARRSIVHGDSVAPKPLTVEEAQMRIEESDRDQVTFRDAESGRLQVLFRRRDGRLELVDVGA